MTTMAKPRCQVVVPPAPRDPDALLCWCSDCKLVTKWNEYSRRFQCPECRSEEWCPTCKSSQIKGRDYCEPTADQKWAKQEREALLLYLFVFMPFVFVVFPAMMLIFSCALHGARVCR